MQPGCVWSDNVIISSPKERGGSPARWTTLFVLGAVLLAGCGDADRHEAPPTTSAAEQRVDLVLKLPQPRYVGTPFNLTSPHLEAPRTGPRPPLPVPPGLSNVALGKPVTASDLPPIMGELSQVTDGDKEGMEGSYVEIGPGVQYFQVDLLEPYEIYAIAVWHFHVQPRIYHATIVRLAADADFTTDVHTVFNNDYQNVAGFGVGKDREYVDSHEGLLVPVPGIRARYVRLYGNGNTESDLNHCTEIEVYGRKPASH